MADWVHPVVGDLIPHILPDFGQIIACGPLRMSCDDAWMPHKNTVSYSPFSDLADSDHVCGTAEYEDDARVERLDLSLQEFCAIEVAS